MKKGQLDAKMLGALLTGVNRAFPFMKGKASMRTRLLCLMINTHYCSHTYCAIGWIQEQNCCCNMIISILSPVHYALMGEGIQIVFK